MKNLTHNFNNFMQANGLFWYKVEKAEKENQFILHADFTKEKPEVGDRIIGIPDGYQRSIPGLFSDHPSITHHAHVLKVIENRSSRGIFNNPKHSKNAFYKLLIEAVECVNLDTETRTTTCKTCETWSTQ